jgi:Nif-specific regulatory protein
VPGGLSPLLSRVLGLLSLPSAAQLVLLRAERGSLRFATSGGSEDRVFSGAEASPRLLSPSPNRVDTVGAGDLDPAFPVDRVLTEPGRGPLVRVRLQTGDEEAAWLFVMGASPAELMGAGPGRLDSAADLLALALDRERLDETDDERRRRGEALEALLPALASALDVRTVFQQVSAVARTAVPHHLLALGLLGEDGKTLRVHALSAEASPDSFPEFRLPDELLPPLSEAVIIHDLEFDPEPPGAGGVLRRGAGEGVPFRMDLDAERYALFRGQGVRSLMRVPVRLQGQTVGGLLFASRDPREYCEDDVAVARRIADHVALALSHQRLAEEARRSAEARERADRLEVRVARLTRELETHGPHRALGRSRPWKDVLAQAAKVAPTETTVLLTGESGTGKEVLARLIHRGSPRAEGPFLALNCAALPEALLESELFGHERGAFTGALSAKPGRIEQAAGGVLFLDEVGEMSPFVQAKLLRVLQEREFQRLGGTRPLRADVRLLAATNRDLAQARARGEFREDLYYRLHVFEIALPPLRERPEDVLVLADAFLAEIGAAVGRPSAGLSREAKALVLAYPWPGNVRELRNALERAVILCEGGLITSEHLPIALAGRAAPPAGEAPRAQASRSEPPSALAGKSLSDVEREMVMNALEKTGHNKSRAARLLGLTRAQLYSRLQRYALATDPVKPEPPAGPRTRSRA